MSKTFPGIYGELHYNKPNVGGFENWYEHFNTPRQHTGGTMRFNLTKVSGTRTGANLPLAGVSMYLRSSNGQTAVRTWVNKRGWQSFGVVPAGMYSFSVRPYYAGGRVGNLWFHGTLETSIQTGAH